MAIKKSASYGFHIPRFYVIYLAVTVAVVLIIIASLGVVSNRLAEYEDTQPKYVAAEVFSRYFEPAVNYDALLADARYDHSAGTPEMIKLYLVDEIGNEPITYSIGSSNDTDEVKFIVLAGSKQLASINLKPMAEKTEHGYTQYEFSYIELYINSDSGDTPPETSDLPTLLTVSFDIPSYCTVTVDGAPLKEDDIFERHMRDDALKYYPSDAHDTGGVEYTIYKLNTLEELPESVVVTDPEGTEAEVTFDSDTNTYTANITYSAALAEEYSEFVTEAIESYAAFVQRVPGTSLSKLKKSGSFDLNSDVYADIEEAAKSIWMVTTPSGNDFENVYIGEFFAHTDSIFSCHISFTQLLHRDGNEDYPDQINMYVFLHKVDDKYQIYEWYNA